MKNCEACGTPTKTWGKYREPKIMRIHVAGRECFLCPSCREEWGEMRLELAIKYGKGQTRGRKYIAELNNMYSNFFVLKPEKVMLT